MDRALFRLARQGLSRLSPAAVAEFGALAQLAHHAGLVRIERELEALGTMVERYLARDPLFHAVRLLELVNRVWLLNRAARAALATGADPAEHGAALGEARRSYEPVPEALTVQAVGARGWVTDSDFVGITVMLRCGDRLLQASNARPCVYFGREPLRLLRMPLSETLGMTVQQLAHGSFVFDGAKLSADGRLSMHAGLHVRPAAWQGSSYAGLTAATWDALVELLRAASSSPIAADAGRMVLIEPVGWSPVDVDEKRSEARATLTDRVGATLVMRVPLRPENNLLVDNLQILARRADLRPPALFGRASAVGGLSFQPWTAVYGVPVRFRGPPDLRVNEVHLGLEDLERVTP